MIHKRHIKAGFTVIELLIYMAVAGAAIVIATSFMVDVVKQSALIRGRKEVQDQARLVMSRIEADIKSAASIDAINMGYDQLALHYLPPKPDNVYACSGSSLTLNGIPLISTNVVKAICNSADATVKPFQNRTASPDEVTINIVLEQKNASAGMPAYREQLTSTVVRRGLMY